MKSSITLNLIQTGCALFARGFAIALDARDRIRYFSFIIFSHQKVARKESKPRS